MNMIITTPFVYTCTCRYDFAKPNTHVVQTKLHWHAHAVADLCFTSDGETIDTALTDGAQSLNWLC